MNSWKLNSNAGFYFRQEICKGLNIHYNEIYKTIKDIDHNGVIETKDGKKYQLELKEIKNK
jgi:predicted transcriptional regulator